MKPYPRSTENLNIVTRVFNYRLSRARNIIENTFGVMSAVFRVLRKPLLLLPEKVISVTCALARFFMHCFL
jgi:hypothetical protein